MTKSQVQGSPNPIKSSGRYQNKKIFPEFRLAPNVDKTYLANFIKFQQSLM